MFLLGCDFTIFLAVLLLILIFVSIFHSWILRYWNYFDDKNVAFKRGLPGIGTHYKMIFGKTSMAESFQNIYNSFPKKKIIGLYEMGGRPSYCIRDPELIRNITIKDYDYFLNHYFQLDKSLDPLLGRSLFSMSNQPWRDMRSTLSPLFTGSKMRFMMTLMIECVENFNSFIGKEIAKSPSKGHEYNMMELLTKLTNDIIGSTAFGLQINTMENPDNEFYKAGESIAYAILRIRTFFIISFPRLASWFRMKIVEQEHEHFFRDVVRRTVAERKQKNIVRNDMLHLLLLAQEGKLDEQRDKEDDQDTGFATIFEVINSKTTEKLKNWTEDDLVAQCVVFFLAGFTGVATTFSFLCYELSVNEEIQERLYQEVLETNDKMAGKQLTFESLQKMKYMDMVISETLRLWPIGAIQDRAVSKQYIIDDTDGNKVLLQPNDIVWIPVYAIHRDPEYYHQPNAFIPERFSDENKQNIRSGTYLPFGLGPRACIASRFALLQLKVVIYHILLRFKIECTEKTPIPMRLKSGTGALTSTDGFWNRLTPRN